MFHQNCIYICNFVKKNLNVKPYRANIVCKVHIFWEGHKNFGKSSPNFWLQFIRSKVRGRFRKIVWPSQNIWTLKVRMQLQKVFWSNFGILSFCVPTFTDRQQHERQILVQNTNFYINVTSERTGDDNRKVVMKTFIDASWCITCIVWELGVTMG